MKKILSWLLFSFAFLSGIGAYGSGARFAGIFMICAAVVACPLLTKTYIARAEAAGKSLSFNKLIGISVVLLVLGFVLYPKSSSTSSVDSAQNFEINSFELSNYYNIFAQENNYPNKLMLPYEFDVITGDKQDSFSYGLTPRVAVSGVIDKSTSELREVSIVFQPDGSESTMADVMFVYSGILNALDIDLSKSERSEAIIGTLTDLTKGKEPKEKLRNLVISGSQIEGMGFFIFITPA